MDPKTPQYWANLFWTHFKPQIQLGSPVYFTFDINFIRKLCNEDFKRQASIKVEEYFNSAHDQLLRFGKVKATLTPFALEKQKNGFSCAIVLAAQQILVVEEMAMEEMENFTQDAYFPRYRKKINFMGSEVLKHSNPFERGDFENIWSCLKMEILSIPGANTSSVTFKEGKGKKNRTRNFPISQALLSRDDLQKLSEEVSDDMRASKSFFIPDSLLSFFDRYKLLLTRRGREKINTYGLRNAIYDQFENFLENPRLTPHAKKKKVPLSKDERGIFIVSPKLTGFRKIYRLRYKIDFERTFFEEEAWSYLGNFVHRSGIFIFRQTKGLGYSNKQMEGEIREGNPFVLLYESENEIEVKQKLDNIFGSDWDNKLFRKMELDKQPREFKFYICESLPSETGIILYKSGRLIDDEIIPVKERLKCEGGIILNKTQNLYLKNYPPEKFQADSYKLSPDDIVTVNQVEMKVGELSSSFFNVDNFESFHITFNNFKLDLKIKSSSVIPDLLKFIGFRLINDEYFSPLATGNGSENLSLRGWVLPSYDKKNEVRNKIPLEMFEVAWLMRGPDRTWMPTTEAAIQMVIENLHFDGVPNSIGKFIKTRLLINKALPVSLIMRHKDLEIAHAN
jgi:hypothetical protein